MDPRERDELRMLQARLYGPGGDLRADDAAAERLAQLTARRPGHGSPAREAPSSGPEQSAVEAALDDDPANDDIAPSSAEHPGRRAGSRRARSRRLRRLALAWAGSLAVAVLLTAVVTSALVSRQPFSDPLLADTIPIAVLEVDESFEVPDFFVNDPGTADAAGFDEFNGVRAIVATGGYGFSQGSEDQTCLIVVISSDLGTATEYSYDGVVFEGCAANDFPASVQFVVSEGMPEVLRDNLPVDTGLRFVYDEATRRVSVSASEE